MTPHAVSTPRRIASSPALWTLVVVLPLVCACDGSDQDEDTLRSVGFAGRTMGTTYSVRLARPPASRSVADLAADVTRLLEGLDASLSTYRPDSEVSRFNATRSTAWHSVGRDTWRVLEEARLVAALSDGALDVTIAPLVALWGFGPGGRPARRPAEDEIARARARVGMHCLRTQEHPPALRKTRKDVEVDLGAIGKGYAVDRIGERLEELGVASYLVEIGGEIRARGRNGRGGPWTVAIQRPNAGRATAEVVIRLEEAGVATSGDYRKWFEQDGVRYSHLLDPRDGRPASHGLASVTVVARSTMRADALATALLVLGPEPGLRLARALGLAALFITRSEAGFTTTSTAQFDRLVVHRRPRP